MKTTLITITKPTTCCRGGFKDCLAKYYPDRKKIPVGTKALKIEISSSQGFTSSFYCQNCMIIVLKNMKKCLEEYE